MYICYVMTYERINFLVKNFIVWFNGLEDRLLLKKKLFQGKVLRKVGILYYVNYMDEHPVRGGEPFDASVLQPSGWRSLSLLFGQFGWVSFASPSASKLLRDNEGTPYYRDLKQFRKDG
jgi:hypothetical protein